MFSKTAACIILTASLFFVVFGSLAMVRAMEQDSSCPFSVLSGSECHAVESPHSASLHHLSMARLISAASLVSSLFAFFALLAYAVLLAVFCFVASNATRAVTAIFPAELFTLSASARFIHWFSRAKPLYHEAVFRVYAYAS